MIFGIGNDTISTPMQRITIAGEHEIAVDVRNFAAAQCIATKLHMLACTPFALQIVIVVGSLGRFTVSTGGAVVVIHETAHTETFIINNVITKVYAIDSAIANRVT